MVLPLHPDRGRYVRGRKESEVRHPLLSIAAVCAAAACVPAPPAVEVPTALGVVVEVSALPESRCTSAGPWFEEGPAIPFRHVPPAPDPMDRYARDHGGAVAVCDFDQDGTQDLFFGQGDGCNALFFGVGDGSFEAAAPLGDLEMCGDVVVAAAPADWNGDGRCDLALGVQHGDDAVFLNRGGGRFERVDDPALADARRTISVTPGDFDNDGILDLYAARFLEGFPTPTLDDSVVAPNALYLGNGDGTFVEGSDRLPPEHARGAGMTAAAIWNYTFGGLDLYVVNDKGEQLQPNHHSINDGDGGFRTADSGGGFDHGLGAMGIATAVLHGEPAFFITSHLNLFLEDLGRGLLDTALGRRVEANDPNTMGWGGTWLRAPRNDGSDGVLVWGQGEFRDRVATDHATRSPPMMVVTGAAASASTRVRGDESFFEHENRHGYVRADFDGDGLPDLLGLNTWTSRDRGVQLARRCGGDAPVRVELLDARGAPPYGIRVRLDDRAMVYGADNGLYGAAWPQAFFSGSGDLEIDWPDGHRSVVPVEAGHSYRVRRRPDGT